MNRIVVVDVETSGLSPRNCGILEIGAVVLDPVTLVPLGETFFRPVLWTTALKWEDSAEAVHGISREAAMAPNRVSRFQAVADFLDWLDRSFGSGRWTLAGMNPHFDRSFLQEVVNLAAVSVSWPDLQKRFAAMFSHRMIDMHSLATPLAVAKGVPIGTLYTDGIYELLGMDPEPKPHEALRGAAWEAEAISMLLRGKGAA